MAAYGAVRGHERHAAQPVVTFPCIGSHPALAVAPTEKWICSGNQDAAIHIWPTLDGSELTLSAYPEKVSRLAFDDTGFRLAADGAPDLTVWDFSGKGPAGTPPRQLRCHETVTALAWRPRPRRTPRQRRPRRHGRTLVRHSRTASQPAAPCAHTRRRRLRARRWPGPDLTC